VAALELLTLNLEIMSKEKTELEETTTQPLLIADVSKSLAPHLCPVCNGNGLVPNGFYMQTSGYWSTSSITPETCRSCNGTGIVWG
jgi:DnaJ-class molecular chaperone